MLIIMHLLRVYVKGILGTQVDSAYLAFQVPVELFWVSWVHDTLLHMLQRDQ